MGASQGIVGNGEGGPIVAIERLTLTNYRSYATLKLDVSAKPVVLTGPNGSGKTNILEAVSLLAPGQGLRRAHFRELARTAGDGGWAVSAVVRTGTGSVDIGTGQIAGDGSAPGRRAVRIDHAPERSSAALAEHLEIVWLTPAMDGLFTGASSERRRFLDRLIACFDTSYRSRLNQFERAMRQRNRLLEQDGVSEPLFEGLELQMAETAIAITAARLDAIEQILASVLTRRDRGGPSPFPWIDLTLDGQLETWLSEMAAVDAEDAYLRLLHSARGRDRAARRTLVGPHRSDLAAYHGPKETPAKVCSTGEQKALLINLVLAHAEIVKRKRSGAAPVLLLDEIAAHLDAHRRAALFEEILALGSQAWMTGTDRTAFAPLAGNAQYFEPASA